MVQIVFYCSLLIAVVSAVFALQNVAPITVRFLAWQFQSSLALLLLLTFCLGVLASVLAALPARFRYARVLTEKEKKIRELSNNLVEYKQVLNPTKTDD